MSDQPQPQLLSLIDTARAIKSAREIAHSKKAAFIVDAVFSKIKKYLYPGLTELQVSLFIEQELKKLGVRYLAFHPIVASGKNSFNIHHWPTSKKINNGEQVMIDFGAVVSGYCSDMTRMLFLGKPTSRQISMYNAVLKAQRIGINSVKPKITGGTIDKKVRKSLHASGLEKYFTHNLGHGVGQYIHEWPRLGKNSPDMLVKNMVVTMEPGVYIKNWGGVRIEDAVLITDHGCIPLTKTPKDIKTAIVIDKPR